MNKAILMIKRANKYDELIEPMLKELSSHKKDLAHYFIVGFMSNHIPIKILKNLQKELKEYISNFE